MPKLTEMLVREIRHRAQAGASYRKIARDLNLNREVVGAAGRGKTWKSLDGAGPRRIRTATRCRYGHLITPKNTYYHADYVQCKQCRAARRAEQQKEKTREIT